MPKSDAVPEAVPLRVFMETAPLYTPTRVEAPGMIALLMNKPTFFPDALRLRCSTCTRETTWKKSAESTFADGFTVAYACADCTKARTGFFLRLEQRDPKTVGRTLSNAGPTAGTTAYESTYATKLGQSELPLPHTPRALTKLLGSDQALYRKGLACMAEGFGLGAVAYFRRVIEDKASDILGRMRHIAVQDGDAESVTKIDEANASHKVSDRLRLAVDAVPPALRPGGMNPLGILYGAFSEEIHASESDDTALETARALQGALDVLVRKLVEHDDDVKQLAALQKAKP